MTLVMSFKCLTGKASDYYTTGIPQINLFSLIVRVTGLWKKKILAQLIFGIIKLTVIYTRSNFTFLFFPFF